MRERIWQPNPLKEGGGLMCKSHRLRDNLGARLRGRTGTQRSKKGSEKVLGRVLGKGSQTGSEKRALLWVLQLKRVLRRVLREGFEKGVSRRCVERPLGEYAPLGVRPKNRCIKRVWQSLA